MKPIKTVNEPVRVLRGVVVGTLVLVLSGTAAASGETGSSGSGSENEQDTLTVESYETRPNPTHEVSLEDGRV